jgi:hypothetical protein
VGLDEAEGEAEAEGEGLGLDIDSTTKINGLYFDI